MPVSADRFLKRSTSAHQAETAGLQYLSPDVQLLYKAKALRPKDQEDFERVRPRLRPDETRWLRNALELEHPGHPWIAALA
jgi:hypothetical protein